MKISNSNRNYLRWISLTKSFSGMQGLTWHKLQWVEECLIIFQILIEIIIIFNLHLKYNHTLRYMYGSVTQTEVHLLELAVEHFWLFVFLVILLNKLKVFYYCEQKLWITRKFKSWHNFSLILVLDLEFAACFSCLLLVVSSTRIVPTSEILIFPMPSLEPMH